MGAVPFGGTAWAGARRLEGFPTREHVAIKQEGPGACVNDQRPRARSAEKRTLCSERAMGVTPWPLRFARFEHCSGSPRRGPGPRWRMPRGSCDRRAAGGRSLRTPPEQSRARDQQGHGRTDPCNRREVCDGVVAVGRCECDGLLGDDAIGTGPVVDVYGRCPAESIVGYDEGSAPPGKPGGWRGAVGYHAPSSPRTRAPCMPSSSSISSK